MEIKKDFKILETNLIYLDSAATSLTPNQVIEAMSSYYLKYNSNIHRGIYSLSVEATEIYENIRKQIAKFINASPEEIIFTKGTTESINIIANSLKLQNNENIVLTKFEHHSNIVPWKILSKKNNNEIKYLGIKDYQLNENDLEIIDKNTKIVSFTYASNVTGTILPVKKIIQKAKENNSLTHIDAAQIVPHKKIDVKELDCDFLSFSGHKILGPTGIGVLYGKKKLLEKINPLNYGGNMISDINEITFNDIPFKFEAGTPNISAVFGLGEAINYIEAISFEKIDENEKRLTKKLIQELEKENAEIYGLKEIDKRLGIVSFNLKNINHQDLTLFLNEKNIAIRSGHHCAMPLLKEINVKGCCRISLYIYNTEDDINKLILAIKEAKKIFGDKN